MTCCPTLPGLVRRRPDASSIVGEVQTVAPAELPLTLAEARKQIEYPDAASDHDEHLTRLIAAAANFVEEQTQRQIVTATWTFKYDGFPPGRSPFWIPRAPLQSITSISYLDAAGATQVFAGANYKVATDREPGRVSLSALGAGSWPTAICEGEPVTVVAVCGYGAAAAVPASLKQLLLFLVDEWFNRRSGVGEAAGTFVQTLLESFRVGFDYGDYLPAVGDYATAGVSW